MSDETEEVTNSIRNSIRNRLVAPGGDGEGSSLALCGCSEMRSQYLTICKTIR